MTMRPHALVRIRLFESGSDGGRVHRPILGNQFGCPVFFDSGTGHDARFYLSSEKLPLSPGDEVTVPIKFLCPDEVRHLLSPDSGFRLWESGFFAEGEVVSRLMHEGAQTSGADSGRKDLEAADLDIPLRLG